MLQVAPFFGYLGAAGAVIFSCGFIYFTPYRAIVLSLLERGEALSVLQGNPCLALDLLITDTKLIKHLYFL